MKQICEANGKGIKPIIFSKLIPELTQDDLFHQSNSLFTNIIFYRRKDHVYKDE
jgi:hypothetical protein